MLMYGTTMFLVHTVHGRSCTPSLWSTVGAFPGTRNLAGGMATSGASPPGCATSSADDYPELLAWPRRRARARAAC